jgi:DNA segregation ATPase FtsK/SpoIIIE-like protein
MKNYKSRLELHYEEHKVEIELFDSDIEVEKGWCIYKVKLDIGAKKSLLYNRASDIKAALELSYLEVIEIDSKLHLVVSKNGRIASNLETILESSKFRKSFKKMELPVVMGVTPWGGAKIVDLVKLINMLIVGPPSTGKSTLLQSIITSLIYVQKTHKLNLILFDIGSNSLTLFDSIPHLSYKIVKDIDMGIGVIESCVTEVNRRANLSPDELNHEPYVVIVMDELVSTVSDCEKEKANRLTVAINTIIRRGRKLKFIPIFATHDSTIKNNKIDIKSINTRIALRTATAQESVFIVGRRGAEKLTKAGEMYFKSPEQCEPMHLQGAYMKPKKILEIVNSIKESYNKAPSWKIIFDSNKFIINDVTIKQTANILSNPVISKNSCEIAKIILWVLEHEKTSALQIQKRFRMGNRADSVMDELLRLGIVSEQFAKQPRTILPKSAEDLSDETIAILSVNGVSTEEVQAAIDSRSEN